MEPIRNQVENGNLVPPKQNHKKLERRSRSTANIDNEAAMENGQGHFVHQNNPNFRKTTAEIISEARTLLLGTSNSGVRLVSTRRPITPRDPRRQLFGKAGPPGRPPSAFCLRYLQSEIRNLPALEPIPIPTIEKEDNAGCRSQSVGPRLEVLELKPQGRLPALPKIGKTPSNLNDSSRNSATGRTSRKRASSRRNSNDVEERSPEILPEDENENCAPTSGMNLLSSRKLFPRNFDILAQSSTETLTEMLKQHAGIKECTEETVQHINAILLELYSRIKSTHGSWRCALLGGLYGLVECTSPKILLAVARVVLGLRVTGSNLTGACKLVFKVARNEANDYLFHDTDVPELLIDGLGRASPMDEPEACIYGYGTVRFLTSVNQRHSEVDTIDFNKNEKFWESKHDLPQKPSTAPPRDTTITAGQFRNQRQSSLKQVSIAQRLSKHGAVQLMVLHLQMLNEAGAIQKLSGPPLHSLYQLSAALRALAGSQQACSDAENIRAKSAGVRATIDRLSQCLGESTPEEGYIHLELACPHLIKAAEISIGELEIQANIVRTLSVLSEDTKCCEALSQFTGKIGMLLGPCQHKFSESPDKQLSVLSRLGYILGNIMARYDSARVQFYYNDVAMQYFFDALEFYSNQKLTLQNQMGDSVTDVLIKLIRVLANMSVNCEVGEGLGTKPGLGAILLHILRCTSRTKVKGMTSEVQELLNAALGALHNLCFYQDQASTSRTEATPKDDPTNEGSIYCVLAELGATLCQILKCGHDSSRIEAARVLGNLSRNQVARESFCGAGGVQIIVQCFGSPEYDLKTSAVGVLVNLLGDWENRPRFMELKGPVILTEMLRRFLSQEDWLVAGIICQAFWNLFIDTSSVVKVLGVEETDTLSDILAEYLDEHQLFIGTKPDAMWEHFALVATDLLERIQMNLSSPFHSFDDNSSETDDDDVHIEEMPEERSA